MEQLLNANIRQFHDQQQIDVDETKKWIVADGVRLKPEMKKTCRDDDHKCPSDSDNRKIESRPGACHQTNMPLFGLDQRRQLRALKPNFHFHFIDSRF